MGILITVYNSLFGIAKFGEDRFGKLEVETDTTNAYKKTIRKTFYKDDIDTLFIKSLKNIFYK